MNAIAEAIQSIVVTKTDLMKLHVAIVEARSGPVREASKSDLTKTRPDELRGELNELRGEMKAIAAELRGETERIAR